MSYLTLRDQDHDTVLDAASLRGIRGGHPGHSPGLVSPPGVSSADSTGLALAIGPNAFAKTDTFAVAVPGASSAGSLSEAIIF